MVDWAQNTNQLFSLLSHIMGSNTQCTKAARLTVSIHLVDHVLQLSLRGVLTQRPHHRAQFFGGDGAVAVLVEQRERLLELWGGEESTE